MENTKHKPMNRRRLVRSLPHIWDVVDLVDVINKHGDRICFRYFEGREIHSMTYAEFGNMIHETAVAFNAMDLAGKKIVVIGDNSPRWLCTYLAALASGCVIVPMGQKLHQVLGLNKAMTTNPIMVEVSIIL